MKKPKPKSRDNVLTPKERERLVEAAKTDEEILAVKGLLYTGMRVSEFLHFKGEWIDWGKGIITIPLEEKCSCYECSSKGSHKGVFRVKTSHASRTIPILPETKDLFRNFFSQYECILDFLYNRVNIWKAVKVVGERARISHKVFPHSLRSSFASLMADRGFDAFTIQAVLGWKSIDIANLYVKMSGTAIKDKFKELW